MSWSWTFGDPSFQTLIRTWVPGAYSGGSLESFGSWLTRHKHTTCWIWSPYLNGDPWVVKSPHSKQQHVHVAPESHTWSQCKCLLFFLFLALKLKSGLWAQPIGLKYLMERFSLYGLEIGDYCIFSSSFSIYDKAASISVPDFPRIGQRIFWQSLSGFCPMVQSF